MLNEEQIKEEAKKRIATMDPKEKERIISRIEEGKRLSKKVANEGYKSLTREEQAKFHSYQSEHIKSKHANQDYDLSSVESSVMNKLKVTREEIKNMKKNPFKAGMFKQIILTVLANLGILATGLISKSTGVNLNVAIPVLSGASGLFALGFGEQLVNAVRFRRLQKAYNKDEFDQNAIDAEVFQQLKRNVSSQATKGR